MFSGFMPYFIIIFVYTFLKLPDILYIKEFSSIVFPLNALYIAGHLLFTGWQVNPDLANTLISPVNGSFIYPPGIYILSKLLGSVGHIFFFLFVLQLFVPIFIYHLIKKMVPSGIALMAAILSSYYFTSVNWWAPDWIIQPLMILLVLVLVRNSNLSILKLLGLGILTGLIMVLKHNIGIMLTIAVLTWILIQALETLTQKNRNRNLALFSIVAMAYLAFGMAVGSKLSHWDERIFYLFPYITFWALIIYFYFKTDTIGLNPKALIKQASIFILAILVIPAAVFYVFGREVGFVRYAHSFFMGLGYAHIWDLSYLSMIKSYCHFAGIKGMYVSLVHMGLFLLPLGVNILGAWRLASLVQDDKIHFVEMRQTVQIISLGIMGIFLFYPLEGYHILATKLFIYVFVFFYLVKGFSQRQWAVVLAVLMVLSIALLLFGAMAFKTSIRQRSSTDNDPRFHQMIGMPMKSDIAQELIKQVDVMDRSIKGEAYEIIGSDGGDLASLLAIVNNPYKEYYLEIRQGFLKSDSAQAMIKSLKDVSYVVVNADDDSRFLNKEGDDVYFKEVMGSVHQHFSQVDHYEAPANPVEGEMVFHSFNVMKRI